MDYFVGEICQGIVPLGRDIYYEFALAVIVTTLESTWGSTLAAMVVMDGCMILVIMVAAIRIIVIAVIIEYSGWIEVGEGMSIDGFQQ